MARDIYNNPVCTCKELCTKSNQPRTALTTETNQPTSYLIEQDTTHPTGFFRFPPEIRDKIYFLSFRPDCTHSFGKSQPCSKRHVHQSSIGRRNAWKWLALCHQSCAEASLYHPLCRNEVKLIVTSDDCARCEYDGAPVLEGALHAQIAPRLGDGYRWEEHWLARVRDILLELDTEEMDHDHEPRDSPRHDIQRFSHNLESVVSFVAGLRFLEKFTMRVMCTFHKTMLANPVIAESVTRLLSILKQKKETYSLNVGIIEVVVVKAASVLQQGAPDQVTEGNTTEPLLQIAASVGFNSSDITTSVLNDRRKNYSTAADIRAHLQIDPPLPTFEVWRAATLLERRNVNVQLELRFRIAVFDEDFDELSEDEKRIIRQDEEATANGVIIVRHPCGPTYIEDTGGCVQNITPKYPRYGTYGAGSDIAPLYLIEDFYHGLTAAAGF
ncbi:hypothetical protein G7Y79_00010g028260 [Physcia stellaris]|nr:hypothetical protein G7Y79_00010g028260 [Physcia stellaris]